MENLPNSTLNRDTFYVLNSTINQTVQFFKIRLYSTLNRVIWENFRTVHLIETVQLIESSEYIRSLASPHVAAVRWGF